MDVKEFTAWFNEAVTSGHISKDDVAKFVKNAVVDNAIDMQDVFGDVWTKEDLQRLMYLKGKTIFKKTQEYGFSYCQAGLPSCQENIRRKYHRLIHATHGISADLSNATDEQIDAMLEALLDGGNYNDLVFMFVCHQRPEVAAKFMLRYTQYTQPIAEEFGMFTPTHAELHGFASSTKMDKGDKRA